MNNSDEYLTGQTPPPDAEDPGDQEENMDDDLLDDFISAILRKNEQMPKSRGEMEISEKGYTRRHGQIFLQSKRGEDAAQRGAEIAASLTDENFADPLSRRVWEMLSEKTQNSVLVDFQCTGCLLWETQGISMEETEEMTRKQLDAVMAKALELRRAQTGSPEISADDVTQIENICISFAPSDAPGAMEGKNAIQIAGTCVKCGCDITRTLMGEKAQLYSTLGNLMKLIEDTKPAKTGRNDPCPCGSGKKYKKCCGKAQ